MAQGTCKMCAKETWVKARGMCRRCYDIERHGGRITDPHHAIDVGAWLASKAGTSGCWPWPGLCSRDGYGRPAIDGRPQSLHRHAWKVSVGPIPDGMTVDHLCHTEALRRGQCAGGITCLHRRCANPAHLELVPGPVNTLRGSSFSAINAAKESCDNGHEFSAENTYYRKDRPGQRECRECSRRRNRDYEARKRAARKAAA